MTVADERGRRWDAATGIGFAIASVVALGLPGVPPKADASVAEVSAYFVDNRAKLLAADFLLGLALVLFVWFLGAVRSYLRSAEGGEGRLSAAAFGGGVAAIGLLAGGAAVTNGLAFEVAGHGGGVLERGLYDTSTAFFGLSGFGFAAFFAAASCSGARSRALSPALYWTGSVIAVLQVVAGVSLFAAHGFLAVGGAMGFVAPLTALLWIVALSVTMMRREGVPPRPLAEP